MLLISVSCARDYGDIINGRAKHIETLTNATTDLTRVTQQKMMITMIPKSLDTIQDSYRLCTRIFIS